MDAYDLGDPVPLTLRVVDLDGAPLVPTSILLELVDPAGLVVDVPDDEIELLEPGLYGYTPRPADDGVWLARWATAGPGAGVQEYAFVVRPEGSALPYAATVEGVRDRVLNVARPAGVAPAGGGAKAARVSDATITEWLLEASARVSRKLRALVELGTDENDPLRLEYRLAARGLVELYAAALLWDATYPQAAKGDRYGSVLMERYEKGLAELAGDLAVDVEARRSAAPGVDPDVNDAGALVGSSAIFPPRDPRLGRYAPW